MLLGDKNGWVFKRDQRSCQLRGGVQLAALSVPGVSRGGQRYLKILGKQCWIQPLLCSRHGVTAIVTGFCLPSCAFLRGSHCNHCVYSLISTVRVGVALCAGKSSIKTCLKEPQEKRGLGI